METVEVVIKISKEDYEYVKEIVQKEEYSLSKFYYNIANGIVLPKGHGDLVDWGKVVDIVTEYVPDDDGSVGNTNLKDLLYEVENMERVIEADRQTGRKKNE